MRSRTSEVPEYRTMTLVVTALMPDAQGELAHVVVMDTTSIEQVDVRYVCVPASRR